MQDTEGFFHFVFGDVGTGRNPVLDGAEEPTEAGLGADVIVTHELDELGSLAVHRNRNAVLSEPASDTVVGPGEVVEGLAVGGRVMLAEQGLDLGEENWHQHSQRILIFRNEGAATHIICFELSSRLEEALLDEPIPHV